MERLKGLFGQTAFQVWVFCLCLLLFNWPLLTIFPLERQDRLFIYLFSAWGFIIVLLFLISRCCSDEEG